MKNMSKQRGGEIYTAPTLDAISVRTEKGFALSEVKGADGTVNNDQGYGYEDPYLN